MIAKEYHRKIYIQPLIEVVDTEDVAGGDITIPATSDPEEDVDESRQSKGTTFFFDDDEEAGDDYGW